MNGGMIPVRVLAQLLLACWNSSAHPVSENAQAVCIGFAENAGY